MTNTTITRKDLTRIGFGAHEVTIGHTVYVIDHATADEPGRYTIKRRNAGAQEPADYLASMADVIDRLNEYAEDAA